MRRGLGVAAIRNTPEGLACGLLLAMGFWLWSGVEDREMSARFPEYASYRRATPGLFVLAPYLSEYAYPWIDEHMGPWPVLGPLFAGPPLGIGMLTAGLVLAIMVIPFISSVMREVFQTVPNRLKESAYALGSTKWEVVWDVVLPYTRSAVIGGIFLGLGRALGETMAVTFVIGNAYNISASLLEPGTSIASTIANEFGEAVDPLHKSTLLALGFLLFVLTFIVLSIAKLMLMQLQRKEGR